VPQRAGSWAEEQAREDSRIRTQAAAALQRWLPSAASWDLFATYTWDPDKGTPPRRGEHVQTAVRAFHSNIHKTRPGGCQAITFAEPHRSGFWHGHGLIALPGGLLKGDLKHLHKHWYERHGYVRFETPQSEFAVSRYLAKYLVKQKAEWCVWPDAASQGTTNGWFGRPQSFPTDVDDKPYTNV